MHLPGMNGCQLCKDFGDPKGLKRIDLSLCSTPDQTILSCPYYVIFTHVAESLGLDVHELQIVPGRRCRDGTESGCEFWHKDSALLTPPPHRDARLLLYTQSDSQLPGVSPVPRITSSNDSDHVWNFIRTCNKLCRECHATCNENANTSLPPRLLQIGQSHVRLVQTDELTARDPEYLALSYCWGSSTSLCTTQNNLQAHKTGIPLESLPSALRDAVVIASKLSQTLLWIDRLCIIQDDPQDWAYHAGIMGDIYESAAMVIAATSAAGADESFLGDCSIEPRRQWTVTEFEVVDEENDMCYNLVIRRVPGSDSNFDEPLDKRGWAFQERHLATRYVQYRPSEVVWECATARHSDFRGEINRLAPYFREFDPLDAEGARETWKSAVSDYTRRTFTVPSDRLPGLSGLASRHQQRHLSEQYFAGFWGSQLIDDLVWESRKKSTLSVPNMPSWSWASVSCGVGWPLYGFTLSTGLTTTLRPVSVVSVRCQPSTSNPFGNVTFPAVLHLSGFVVALRLDQTGHIGECEYSIGFDDCGLLKKWAVGEKRKGTDDRDLWRTDYQRSTRALGYSAATPTNFVWSSAVPDTELVLDPSYVSISDALLDERRYWQRSVVEKTRSLDANSDATVPGLALGLVMKWDYWGISKARPSKDCRRYNFQAHCLLLAPANETEFVTRIGRVTLNLMNRQLDRPEDIWGSDDMRWLEERGERMDLKII